MTDLAMDYEAYEDQIDLLETARFSGKYLLSIIKTSLISQKLKLASYSLPQGNATCNLELETFVRMYGASSSPTISTSFRNNPAARNSLAISSQILLCRSASVCIMSA